MIRPLHTVLLTLVALLHTGCAVYTPVADFTRQRYDNTVAYFNTFYNAQRLFSDAEDEAAKARREFLERDQAGRTFVIPSTARQKFQTSIEKNSKLLSFYPGTKWVDDAVMMIGKAYYYMDDDVRSERKFLELAAQFPESPLIPESKLWLAKSFLRQKKTEAGIRLLEEVYAAAASEDDDIAGAAAAELGQHYFAQKDFILAEKNFSEAVQRVNDDELLTQIYFQLGKCYTELLQHDKAMDAYASAAAVSPVYTWIFQAELQRVKATASKGAFDEAVELLTEMLGDSKNTEYFGIIHFEIANILYQQGNVEQAETKYRFVDTAYARTDVAARSYFALAQHYEQRMRNFDSARVLYNKARIEFQASEIAPEALRRADLYTKYADLWKELIKFDSLYRFEATRPDPDDTISSILPDSLVKNDSAAVRSEPKPKRMAKAGKPDPLKDSLHTADSLKRAERVKREKARAVMLDSLERSIARAKFELGGLFFVEIQIPDSALVWFDDIIRTAPNSTFAPRALYSKAEIIRSRDGDHREDVETLYRQLIDRYGKTPYANEARRFLNLPLAETERDTARELFEEAELRAEQKDFHGAIAGFKMIAGTYPHSPLASKALFSAGWHYEHSLTMADSAIAVYRRIIASYPLSNYAGSVRPKVTEYEAEQKRIADEKAQAELEAQEKERTAKEELQPKQRTADPPPSDSLSSPNPNH